MFFLLLLSLIAIVDYRQSRIPNWCILVGMGVGIFHQFQKNGIEGLMTSLIQMAILFLFFYPFYLSKGLGAGDVKLFMMIGCYLNKDEMMKCLLLTFIMAAAKSIICMVRYEESRNRLLYFMGYIRKLCITKTLDEYVWDKTNKFNTVRLAIPAFFSVLFIYGGVI